MLAVSEVKDEGCSDGCYDLILNPTLENNDLIKNFIARCHVAVMPGMQVLELSTKGDKALVNEGHI